MSLALQLLFATVVLHRFAALQTAVAINLMVLAFIASGIAALGAIAALVQIWRFGSSGTAAAVWALLAGTIVLLIPAYYLPVMLRGGATYDISTSPAQPPNFQALGKVRLAAGLDPKALPVNAAGSDPIEPLVTSRSPSDVFDLANDLIRQLDLNIVAEQAPGFGSDDGGIEATDRTLILGLTDDISIRIAARDGATRVDVRSAARYPRLDLGRNVERVQLIIRKLQASIDASVPSDPSLTASTDQPGDTAKSQAGTAAQPTVLRRRRRFPSQANAQGGPIPTVSRH